MDHIRPLVQHGSNDVSNFQPLCRNCHAAKTQEIDLSTRPHLLQSQFSVATRELFNNTRKPKQLSGSCWRQTLEANGRAEPGEYDCFPTVDVVGCRKHALLQRRPRRLLGRLIPRLLPIFAPCDALEDVGPSTWQDCDFVWLELDCCPDDPAVWEQCRPYCGAGLYPVETAEELVAWGIVRAETIRKGLRASRHFDPQGLKMAWDIITEALARAAPTEQRKWEKSVHVQHIGLMGIVTQSKTTVVNSTLPEDVPAEDLILQHRDGKMTLAYETHLVDNRSYYPLNLIALWGEQVAMTRAWRIIRACEVIPRRPLIGAWHIDGDRNACDAPEASHRVQAPRRYQHVPNQEGQKDCLWRSAASSRAARGKQPPAPSAAAAQERR